MEVALLLGLLLSIATARKSGYRTAYVCEGGLLRLSCEDGYLIHLIRANYGRFSISICNEHGSLNWSVDCTSIRSYYVIYERCNLMSSCIVSATSDTFADPCPGTYKYLEVQYRCMLEYMTTSSSSSPKAISTTTVTTRPPIIIPLTRSNKPTVLTIPHKPMTTTQATKLLTYDSSPVNISYATKPSSVKLSTPPPLLNREDHCHPVQSRNLTWNWTKAGTEVVQKCPGGTFGEARWHCGTDPVQWEPDSPDLSECSSLWVENLRNRVNGGDSVVNIATELSVMTHRKPLYGGDVRHATEILNQLVVKMASKMKEVADDKQRHQLLQELLECAGDVTSNLLEVSSSWAELASSERRHIASMLLMALEQSGLLLASAHNSPFYFQKTLHNIILSVRVLEAWTVPYVTFPSAEEVGGTSWEQMEDFIQLPMQTLLGTASNGIVKMVFASYKQVKDFLGTVSSSPKGILYNSSSIINSRIISASTGKYPGIKFIEPVTVTFKLLQEENVTNPQCVYWDLDARLWSQEGCWLKKSNKTHAICECDHLTNFALLMDLKLFEDSTNSSFISKVVILTSCIFAAVLFLITALLLQFFRSFPTDHSAIHTHLCICLTVAEIIYMSGTDQIDIACTIIAGILHFVLQAIFVWIFFSAFQLYLLLLVSTHGSKIHCYSVIAYGIPAVIVSVSLFIDPKSYGTPDYCFLQFDNYYIFSFVGPAVSCILGAVLFHILTICKICSSSSNKNKELAKLSTIKIQNRETWFVVLSCSSSWAFLLLYMDQKLDILAYVFGAFNCLQGLTILIFFGLNNNGVQQAYRKWKEESFAQPKNAANQFPLPAASSQHSSEMPYLQPSTTVSPLSTVTTPELEFHMGTFHHSELYHTSRSLIYNNCEQLVS